MSDDNDILDDDIELDENDYEESSKFNSQVNKLDARKRLEEYLEEKRLRELIEF